MGSRGGARGKKRKFNASTQLTKIQKTNLKEYGEITPSDFAEGTNARYRSIKDVQGPVQPKVVESSSEESEPEPEDAYNLLVNSLGELKDGQLSDNSDSDDDLTTSESSEGEIDSDHNLVGVNDEDQIIEEVDDDDDDEDCNEENDEESEVDGSDIDGQDDSGVLEKDDENISEDDGASEMESGDDSKADNGNDEDDNASETPVSDSDNEVDEEEDNYFLKESDPFTKHFEKTLEDDFVESLNETEWEKVDLKVPLLGKCQLNRPTRNSEHQHTFKERDLRKMHVKLSLSHRVCEANTTTTGADVTDTEPLTAFQQVMFGIINSYQDLYYPDRNQNNGEEIRLAYCLHALNHVLKTRDRIITHNTKMKVKKTVDIEQYRDQGLTRPKVLIVVPFRDSALRIVQCMANLLMTKQHTFLMNKKRMQKEYGSDPGDKVSGNKPDDYKALFTGNIDDHFRIGLGVAKKTLKLYTEFYSSDIILASPLGLRTIINAEGDKEDSDFLSSIELLIFDQADVFLMQNWDHVLNLMSHIHQQPKESHGVDFSRVRMWSLNGWSKFYCQTLVFSSIIAPEITGFINKRCHNYYGKLSVPKSHTAGTVTQIVTQLPQVFERIEVAKFADDPDARFEFFKTKVLPQFKDRVMSHTLIFISSYFDYVRLRNYFKNEGLSYAPLCEYTKEKKMYWARDSFFHGDLHFLLYTERLHFYHRYKIRGVKHLIFYQLPQHPHFYSEMCNSMRDRRKQKMTATDTFSCTVLYSRYDAQRLVGVLGNKRAGEIMIADKPVHMLVTGES